MNIALILSGGMGTRLGADISKQYIKVKGRTILSFCLETLLCHEQVDMVQIVADISWQKDILEELKELQKRNILSYASKENKVLIHDVIRPCLSKRMICDCFIEIEGYDGVLPVLPMKDTVYFSKEGKTIDSLLNRSQIFAGQASEAVYLGRYYKTMVHIRNQRVF